MKLPILLSILLLVFAGQGMAQDANPGFSHDFELASTDFGLPLAGDTMLDSLTGEHKIWWASQAFYAGATFMYRSGENMPQGWHEFTTVDLPFIGLSVAWELIFPPKDK